MPEITCESLRAWRQSRGLGPDAMTRLLVKAAVDCGLRVVFANMRRNLYRWENPGDQRLPDEQNQLLYMKALGLSSLDQLRAGPASIPPLVLDDLAPDRGMLLMLTCNGSSEEESVDRREFGLTAMGLLAGTLVSPPGTATKTVTEHHLSELRAVAARLWERDQVIGGLAQVREAVGAYQHVRSLLDCASYSASTGKHLQALTAEIAACAGFAAHDAGQESLARALLTEAALLAGRDPLLTARAYGLLALQANALAMAAPGRAREAKRFLGIAYEAVRREPSPRVHALIAMRQAVVCGHIRDNAGVQHAIAIARRELDYGDHETDPPWTAFVSHAEITAHEAMARLGEGKPAVAAEQYRAVLSDANLPPRNRALYTARLAGSLHLAGERAEAEKVGLQAVAAVEGTIRSARVLRELRPVRAVAGESEFSGRFDRALAAAS
jgi:hypothetical protein